MVKIIIIWSVLKDVYFIKMSLRFLRGETHPMCCSSMT